MRIVLALGGNALTGPSESVLPAHQIAAVEAAAPQIAGLVAEGHQVLLSHGNGPQVGDIMAKNDIASPVLSPVPLDWCVANTQGSMGFILLNALDAWLARSGLSTRTAVVVSRTVVDADDPAFKMFTKPVGRFVKPEIAQRLSANGQYFVDSGKQGWRRVVASPQPLEIVDAPSIKVLLDAGFLVVAGGGGGIPVIRTEDHELEGVEAVIDKDLNSVLLADQIDAEVIVLATNVDNAWLDWGMDQARALGNIHVSEMRRYLAEGQFPAGSMGPKVEAICRFVENTGGKGIITNLNSITKAINFEAGTVVIPDDRDI